MGGAAAWQFAVHYPDAWCAAAPGAGFSETAEFLQVFQNENVQPTDYERKLWHWYDCPDYAANLFNLPTVAYSGENDRQKQAADVMARALKGEGMELVHVIGPKTGHSYHPEAKKEIDRRIDAIAALGRDRLPPKVKFQTYTLRYHRSFWVTIEAMGAHWAPARVEAELQDNSVVLRTNNVTALTLSMAPGHCRFDPAAQIEIRFQTTRVLNPGQEKAEVGAVTEAKLISSARSQSDRSWVVHLKQVGDTWKEVPSHDTGLRKRHGLQGPIDDAFLDRFVMVQPTGPPMNEAVGKWAAAEMDHAVTH